MERNNNGILPRNWDVPRIFTDRLGNKAGAQRAMFHDGHLLLILHEVPAAGQPEREGIFFWRQPDGTWRTSRGGVGIAPLTQLLDRYRAAVDDLESRLGEAATAEALFAVLRGAGPLQRAAGNLASALQQAREQVAEKEVIAYRDRGNEIARAGELVAQDAKHALDYAMARQVEAQSRAGNEVARSAARLNRLMALFLPVSLIASLFGMNLPSGIETTSPVLFWVLVIGGLATGYTLGRVVQGGSRKGSQSDRVDVPPTVLALEP